MGPTQDHCSAHGAHFLALWLLLWLNLHSGHLRNSITCTKAFAHTSRLHEQWRQHGKICLQTPWFKFLHLQVLFFHLFLLREEKELMQGHRLVLIQTDPLTGARQPTCSIFVEGEARCKSQRDLPNGYSSPVECLASIRRALGLRYSHIPRRERKFVQRNVSVLLIQGL